MKHSNCHKPCSKQYRLSQAAKQRRIQHVAVLEGGAWSSFPGETKTLHSSSSRWQRVSESKPNSEKSAQRKRPQLELSKRIDNRRRPASAVSRATWSDERASEKKRCMNIESERICASTAWATLDKACNWFARFNAVTNSGLLQNATEQPTPTVAKVPPRSQVVTSASSIMLNCMEPSSAKAAAAACVSSETRQMCFRLHQCTSRKSSSFDQIACVKSPGRVNQHTTIPGWAANAWSKSVSDGTCPGCACALTVSTPATTAIPWAKSWQCTPKHSTFRPCLLRNRTSRALQTENDSASMHLQVAVFLLSLTDRYSACCCKTC
mmetsp:Transcript_131130/g.261725  ORF Transcript_131130/g.261725 Transcript_131130/m.261725 type:complete len:322 (-) Transcript_131130:390-1355(-)